MWGPIHPLQAPRVLSTYIKLQSDKLLSLSGLSLQGLCTWLHCYCPHMERRGQRPPPLAHYNSHYHALLFHITVNQLSLRGKGEVWTAKGYWETFSLDTYGHMAGCTVQTICVWREKDGGGVVLFYGVYKGICTFTPEALIIQDLFWTDSV